MKKYRILSAAGADRVGVVHDVSEFLFARGCNMEDSRMAVLGGQFSLMMLFSGDEKDMLQVEKDLPGFRERTGLKTLLAEAVPPYEYQRQPALTMHLEVVAMDAPGIMTQLTGVLQHHRVNIETLDVHLSPAPASGTTVSSIKMYVAVPQEVSLGELKTDLNNLATSMNLDIVFQPIQR